MEEEESDKKGRGQQAAVSSSGDAVSMSIENTK